MSQSSIEDKAKQIEAFVDRIFNTNSDFSNQKSLLKLIIQVKTDLKKEYKNLVEQNLEIYSWSSAKFQVYLADVLIHAEKTVLMEHLKTLKELVELCKSIKAAPQKLDNEQKEIVKIILCGSVVQRNFKMSDTLRDRYFYFLSSKVLKQVQDNLESLSNVKDEKAALKQIMIEAEKNTLRVINWREHTATTVVRQYNLILKYPNLVKPEMLPEKEIFDYLVKKQYLEKNGKISDGFNFQSTSLWEKDGAKYEKYNDQVLHILKSTCQKDATDLQELQKLASGMLDIYREKEDGSYIGENELREITSLAGMKNPEIYRRILNQLIADIDNDALLDAFKLKLLGAVLLPVAGSPDNSDQKYCMGDDLNSCLRLIVRKLDTILISSDNSNLVQMYDSLNIVLNLMVQMKLSGLKEADVELLKKRMDSFSDSTLHAMRKLTGFVKEYGANIPLKAKNEYANQAIRRIGGTWAEEMKENDERTVNAVMGSCNLLVGIVKMDPDTILEGLTTLGELALEIHSDWQYEWYDLVSIIQSQSSSNFTQFKEDFLNDKKTIFNKKLNKFSTNDKENLTFFLIEALYRIASDSSQSKDKRIYCVNTLYKISSRKRSFNWIVVKDDLRFHVINQILRISLLPQKIAEKMQVVDRAKAVIQDIKILMKKDDQEWLDNLRETFVANQTVQFSNSEQEMGNTILIEALKQKMVTNYFLATISQKGEDEYRRYVKPLTMIDIEGHQYIESKCQHFDSTDYEYTQGLLGLNSIAKNKIEQMRGKNLKQENQKVKNHVLITEGIETFLESEARVLLIQGDAGTGKSIYLKLVEHRIYKQFLLGKSDYIPIFVRLSEIKDPSKCIQELLQSFQSSRQAYTKLKESNKKFLFLLDGYDELKVPKNMFITNKLNEWKGTAKLLITSRQEYLMAYGNYQRYFKPNFKNPRQNILLEYRISEVSKEQRKDYIDKTVVKTLNKINSLDQVADLEEIESMKEWSKFEKYNDAITQTIGLEDLIKTPYMLTIIMNILPDLEKQKTSKDEKVTKSTIYKTFTKQYQMRQQNKIMDAEASEIPKGLDLETSFYNFSCSLAILMYINDKTTVQAVENQYPFPRKNVEENMFEEFFKDDEITKLSRSGAQIIQVDGQARFTHKSIMEYFAARVYYEEIKTIKITKEIKKELIIKDQELTLSESWLNDKLLKGDQVTDQESDVLNFVIDMITYNNIKQTEMNKTILDGDKAEEAQSNSLSKLIKLAEAVNKSAFNGEGKVSLEIWQQNILQLSTFFPAALQKIEKKVQEAILSDSESSNNLKELICLGNARMHESHEEPELATKAYLRAVAIRMGAHDYEGEVIGNFPEKYKAHGKGELTYSNGERYVGLFIDGKIQETGEIEIHYNDKSVYKGEWKDKEITGWGTITLENGMSLYSEFLKGRSIGKSTVFKPFDRAERGQGMFDLNQIEKFAKLYDIHASVTETITGKVEKDNKNIYQFNNGFVQIESSMFNSYQFLYEIRLVDNIVSFDFMTQQNDCTLYCLNNDNSDSVSKQEIKLTQGCLEATWFKLEWSHEEKIDFADGKWHHIDVITCLGSKIQFKVDDKIIGEVEYRKEPTQEGLHVILLGVNNKKFAENYFTGSIKNLSINHYNQFSTKFNEISFKKFDTDETNGKSIIDFFSQDKGIRQNVKEEDGELIFNKGTITFPNNIEFPKGDFQIEFDYLNHENISQLAFLNLENKLKPPNQEVDWVEFYQYNQGSYYARASPASEQNFQIDKGDEDQQWHHVKLTFFKHQKYLKFDDLEPNKSPWDQVEHSVNPTTLTLGKSYQCSDLLTAKLKNIFIGRLSVVDVMNKREAYKNYTGFKPDIQMGTSGNVTFELMGEEYTVKVSYLSSWCILFDPVDVFKIIYELYTNDKQSKQARILMNYIKLYTEKEQLNSCLIDCPLDFGEIITFPDKILFGTEDPEQYLLNVRNYNNSNLEKEEDYWKNSADGGYMEFKWDKDLDYPENIMPDDDFEVSIDFCSTNVEEGLFCIRGDQYLRKICLNDGKLRYDFNELDNTGSQVGYFFPSDESYNDGEWHSLRIVCKKKKPVETYMDGTRLKDNTISERLPVQDIYEVNFGYDQAAFKGKMKNGLFKQINIPQQYKIVNELFELE